MIKLTEMIPVSKPAAQPASATSPTKIVGGINEMQEHRMDSCRPSVWTIMRRRLPAKGIYILEKDLPADQET